MNKSVYKYFLSGAWLGLVLGASLILDILILTRWLSRVVFWIIIWLSQILWRKCMTFFMYRNGSITFYNDSCLRPKTVRVWIQLSLMRKSQFVVDTKVRSTRCKDIIRVKVLWSNHEKEAITWETKSSMRDKYPFLFQVSLSYGDVTSFRGVNFARCWLVDIYVVCVFWYGSINMCKKKMKKTSMC